MNLICKSPDDVVETGDGDEAKAFSEGQFVQKLLNQAGAQLRQRTLKGKTKMRTERKSF